MGSLADNSALLVAGLDLSLVRSLTQAIRTADLSAAASAGTGPAVVNCSPAQASVRTVTAQSRSTNCSQPAATFEPCTKHQWHPRLAELQPYTCTRPVLAADAKPFVQPPWKVLPWPTRIHPVYPHHHVIKVQANATDVDVIGRTLDLFV